LCPINAFETVALFVVHSIAVLSAEHDPKRNPTKTRGKIMVQFVFPSIGFSANYLD